jgi:flagellar biosynthesis protein FlhF
MKIKSYFSHTVEDAMALARQELGPDAMLLTSRPGPPEARHLGEYEVVFASLTPGGPALGASASAPVGSSPPIALSSDDRLATEVAELKKELESMRRAITRSAFAPSQWLGASPDLSEAYAVLAASEVAPELARDIVHSAELRLGRRPLSPPRPPAPRAPQSLEENAFQRALLEEVESRFVAEPMLGRGEARPRIVALVGPPGSGKTTTLVKLAVNYGLAARRPVLLLSMDTYRVGAAEQLRSYAAILGVGFQVLETVAALAQAIEENRGKELIFLDTPGLGFGDLENSRGLAHFLATRPDIDVQLVLSSSMKSADLTRVVDAFEILRPQRLLFTRLDETGSYGPILNEAARTGKPLSFFATGQRIPEDLEAVSRSRLAELILAGPCCRARAAA